MNYYSNKIEEIYEELGTKRDGLSTAKANELIEKYGPNELPQKEKESIFKLFLSQFNNPIEMILVVTVFLSFITGEVIDAIALIFIILVDVTIGTYEEWKANKDVESLAKMIKQTSKVMRDNSEIEINSREVVPGDIIFFESGDRISADARIIECHNLTVDESTLTGESINIEKQDDVIKEKVPLAERKNMLYAGTAVVTGRAVAVVVGTGVNTEIGKIAEKVSNTEEEKSPLTIRMERFSKQITVIIIIIAIITTFVLIKQGYKVNKIIVCVIALSVSAMPEGLPLAQTMALTIASKRMAKKHVIVKKLNAVESLGSCTVIASDKTGTLTVNEQTAKKIVLANDDTFEIEGSGYNGDGKVKAIGKAKMSDAKYIAMLGAINNEAHLSKRGDKWESFGDSIDIAFLSLAEKLEQNERPTIIERIPYESENQYSAVFYEKDKELRCTVKGSLEKVLSFSKENERYFEQNRELTSQGYRVIAIADGKVNGTKKKDITDLKFIGLVAFIDPIREEVKESLKECHTAGIKVVMITGDHPLTAFAIAKELGLCNNESEVATGEDVEKHLSRGEEEFDKFVSCIRVFSRVTPMDKLAIVESFKRQGEFVAVTGDGVNDAPAIKSANIGIAMGSGTDVAKETASMIITDDNFTSIVSGIEEGRTAYSNIRKITLFLLGCGFAEVSFFILALIFKMDIPLLAIQLLWLNVVTDGLQDIALSFDPSDKGVMFEKPRNTKESLFSRDLAIEVGILGITITIVVFRTWYYLIKQGVDITTARSVIMMLMVIIQNINVFNCHSEKKSILDIPLSNNKFLIYTVLFSIGLQLVMAEIPLTAMFLKVEPLPFTTVLFIFFVSLIIIFVYEIYKALYNILRKEDNYEL